MKIEAKFQIILVKNLKLFYEYYYYFFIYYI